jgi:biotin transport system permease protein
MRVRGRFTRAPTVGDPTLALYWPGGSWLHRAPAGVKLLALLVGAAVVVAVNHPAVSGALLVAVVVAILGAGVPARVLVRQAKPLVIVIAVLTGFQALIGRPEEGLLAATRLLAVAALALAVTLTTRPTAMVDWLERTLRRIHVRPVRVFRIGLTVGLALRSLDHLGVVARRVLDARRARGLGRSLRAFAVPTVVAAARFAHGVGEALDARGIADPELAPSGDGRDA